MKLFYWSPFLSNIATVDAVVNSITSIKKYDKKKKDTKHLLLILSGSGKKKK